MSHPPLRVVSLLDPLLDRPDGRRPPGRGRWRPTTALCLRDDLGITGVDLLLHPCERGAGEMLRDEVAHHCTDIDLVLHDLAGDERDDLAVASRSLRHWAADHATGPTPRLLHLTTATPAEQVALIVLAREDVLPGRLLLTSPPPRLRPDLPGRTTILDVHDIGPPPAAPRPALPVPATTVTAATVTAAAAAERLLAAARRLEGPASPGDDGILSTFLSPAEIEDLDLFDRVQLAEVLRVCRDSRTLTEAGKRLYAVSRTRRKSVNDADRVRKYLARHGVTWDEIRSH